MDEEAAATAWRLHVFNWLMLAVAGVALGVTLLLADLTITVGSIWIGAGFVGIYGAFAWLNAKFRARKDPQVVFVLGGFAQIVLVTLIMTPLPTSPPPRTCRYRISGCDRSTRHSASTGGLMWRSCTRIPCTRPGSTSATR